MAELGVKEPPRRVAVQASEAGALCPIPAPAGVVDWGEHAKAWEGYAARFGRAQDALTIAARGGFSYAELYHFLGHQPLIYEERPRA